MGDTIFGRDVLATALQKQGIEHCFGIIGMTIQGSGINYYGFRNEQSATYAAGAVGFLTNRPGLTLTVSGPGMMNCISGLANALTNGWPMILLSGSSDLSQTEMGAFQESDQMEVTGRLVKMKVKLTSIKQIPFIVEKAVRISLSGQPGPVYIDAPGDVLNAKENESEIVYLPRFENKDIPLFLPPADRLNDAIALLKPLVIIGKGAAYANASEEMNEFINLTNIPFLPTPMGKGVVSDNHKCCIAAARSRALLGADVILLVGGKLNWILHFGKPPRFDADVKLIQIDIKPEELNQNVKCNVGLCGDIKITMNNINNLIKSKSVKFPECLEWKQSLYKKIDENKQMAEEMAKDISLPMQYYTAYYIIQKFLPPNYILINEGSNTMDIGRTILMHDEPKKRLDAGTFGTMGIGMPFTFAAKTVFKDKPVVAIFGDSAFGFSAMELETLTRYNLPVIIIIMNNNGIFTGLEEIPENPANDDIPVTGLNPATKYEMLAEAFGGVGYRATNHNELKESLTKAFQQKISPYGTKKPQEFTWLTRKNISSKL